MKKHLFTVVIAVVFTILLSPYAAAGEKEQLIQLQTTVQMLQDNLARMQHSFDERMGVIKDLITQQTDGVAKMGLTVQVLDKKMDQRATETTARFDQISGQVQALHDAVNELKARLAKLGKQLDDIQSSKPSTTSSGSGAAADAPQAPPRSPVK